MIDAKTLDSLEMTLSPPGNKHSEPSQNGRNFRHGEKNPVTTEGISEPESFQWFWGEAQGYSAGNEGYSMKEDDQRSIWRCRRH